MKKDEPILVFINTIKKLAKQLNDLGQVITERQVISKICRGLPPTYESLLLAWNSVPIAQQDLKSFQTRLIQRAQTLQERVGQIKIEAEKAFYTHSNFSCSKSKGSKLLTTEHKKNKITCLVALKKIS